MGGGQARRGGSLAAVDKIAARDIDEAGSARGIPLDVEAVAAAALKHPHDDVVVSRGQADRR